MEIDRVRRLLGGLMSGRGIVGGANVVSEKGGSVALPTVVTLLHTRPSSVGSRLWPLELMYRG